MSPSLTPANSPCPDHGRLISLGLFSRHPCHLRARQKRRWNTLKVIISFAKFQITKLGEVVLTVSASDRDTDNHFGVVSYGIAGGNTVSYETNKS